MEEEENLKHAILRFQRRKEGGQGGGGSILDNKQTNKAMRHTNKQSNETHKQTEKIKEGRKGRLACAKQTDKLR